MRRRINRTLLTATAASASVITLGFMATGAVGAATTTTGMASVASSVTPILSDTTCTPLTGAPTPSVNCAVAGYQASNRLFRYASASIVVPSHNGVTPAQALAASTASTPVLTEADAALYVALDDSSDTAYDYARAGVMPCSTWAWTSGTTHPSAGDCTLPTALGVTGEPAGYTATNTSGWETFSSVLEVDRSTTPVTLIAALPPGVEGHGVSVSVYLTPTGNSVHTTITTPTSSVVVGSTTTTTPGHKYNHTFPVSGPIYSTAQAVADWTGPQVAAQTEPYQPTLLAAPANAYAQIETGRFTTWNGTQGTFVGKWITTPFEATLDGTSATAVATSPGYLWSSTKSFKSDAFGVWIRHV